MTTYFNRKIGNILTSGLIHKLIVEPAIRHGFLKLNTVYICVKNQTPYLQSLIYWRIYERSEIRLITKYLKRNVAVIELGASLGMTTTAICKTVKQDVRVISVEANPTLFYNLNETKSKNSLSNLTLISAAVDYSGAANVNFILDESNLGSRKGISESAVVVPTIKLSDIILGSQIEQFSLVCDIEGAELEMFINETHPQVISGCMQIIIELHPAKHNGRSYSRSDIEDLIVKNFHMKTILTDGKTWVFEKQS